MNHKEFFDVLIGNPPPEVELEIEIKCREVKQLPNIVIKEYCCDLVKHVRLQDMLLVAALVRISDVETKNYHLEKQLRQYKKFKKQGLLGKVKYILLGNRTKK
tara:strand:+ start:175 stop:483 length:309 start_codon:yes stop_codon:yes gene_type:complete